MDDKITSKAEKWRLQTLVNRIGTNEDIAREYFTIANYIVDNYPERMETIQAPLLHIMSHCLELALKSVIKDAIDVGVLKVKWESIVHSHSLNTLSTQALSLYRKMGKLCGEDDKIYFSKTFPTQLKNICEILQTNTSSYRYSHKIDKQGNLEGKSLPFVEDKESPNIGEITPLFNDCYCALSYTSHIISMTFPKEM